MIAMAADRTDDKLRSLHHATPSDRKSAADTRLQCFPFFKTSHGLKGHPLLTATVVMNCTKELNFYLQFEGKRKQTVGITDEVSAIDTCTQVLSLKQK